MLASILQQLQQWIESVIRATNYVGIALLMLVENLFPPIPSEIVMPFAGFLINDNQLNLFGVLLAGTIGAMSGAAVIYMLGKRLGEARTRDWLREHGKWLLLKESDLDKAMHQFENNGRWIVLVGRMIPGVRSLISLPAGIKEMPWVPFLFYTALGTLFWNSLLVGAGMLLDSQWQTILTWIDRYEILLWGLLAIWVVYRLYKLFFAGDDSASRTGESSAS